MLGSMMRYGKARTPLKTEFVVKLLFRVALLFRLSQLFFYGR
jgi:hypothetical protein